MERNDIGAGQAEGTKGDGGSFLNFFFITDNAATTAPGKDSGAGMDLGNLEDFSRLRDEGRGDKDQDQVALTTGQRATRLLKLLAQGSFVEGTPVHPGNRLGVQTHLGLHATPGIRRRKLMAHLGFAEVRPKVYRPKMSLATAFLPYRVADLPGIRVCGIPMRG